MESAQPRVPGESRAEDTLILKEELTEGTFGLYTTTRYRWA